MQREIKFRGFHKCENGNTIIIINGEPVRGKWVYGYYFISERDIEDGFVWRDIPQIQQRYGDHYQCFDVIPETIGQYTGLKDKNGKEIYEGDIVNCEKRGAAFYRSVVVYNSKMGRHDVNAMDCMFPMTLDYCEDDISIDGNDYEVIGNIYENPELLKE